MSFYTALTGLNGASADISATSNNIANVGTTGFKRSRAEFGDIFATSPLQNASSSIGSGTILKGIKQQFTQGNISSSLNALDLAISGQGFFALKPSLTSAQIVYTRNGSLSVNDDRYVVDSAGQYLLVFPVNNDGSVTAKDIISASPLQLPVTSGEPQATNNIQIGVNVPAGAEVVTEKDAFADGYTFNPANPETYNNSTSITIFDDLGNPTIATIYFIKTQTASAEDPTNKVTTKLVINDTVIEPDLVKAIDDAGKQLFIDRFGMMPIPPYLNREPDINDFVDYQTVYAKKEGSIAAPTAGLHFTKDLMKKIRMKDIGLEFLTLHVGMGTFLPIKDKIIENHKMHYEEFFISSKLISEIELTKRGGNRILTVGTTTLRALESYNLFTPPSNSWFKTDIFINQGFEFGLTDALLTNFHLPKSSLLVLISSFLGYELTKLSYEYAIKEKFKFYSYGDAMLIV